MTRTVDPVHTLAVRGEEEIAEAVRRARAEGRGIRVLGAGGSKSEVTQVPHTALRIREPDRILRVEGREATVPTGITTGRLQELLRREGLALATVGEWRNATIAGSIATATHGGSAHHGIVSTSVRRVRLVDGTGAIRDVDRHHPDFTHLAVNLGAFGVLTEVTLACDPHFFLRMETDVIPFQEYLEDPVAQESRVEFHASVWMPDAARVIRFGGERTDDPGRRSRRHTRFGKWLAMARFVARRLGFHRTVSSWLFRKTSVGDAGQMLSPLIVPPRVVHFRHRANEVRRRRAGELAIPASAAAEALPRFEAFFRRHLTTLNNPIGLRMNAADDFAVSPCEGRATLWLDIFYDADPVFERELAALADDFEGRCHWGKALALPPGTLRRRYTRWDAFAEARRRYDPDEVFANAFTHRLGLTSRGAPAPAP